MHEARTFTQESFDRLLEWLASDRDQAGEKYEFIRRRLIKIFACRGCHEAEDLADETINRVILKIDEIIAGYDGDPAHYFYGVANKIYLESLKRHRPVELLTAVPSKPLSDSIENDYECLERCMNHLPPAERDLILRYYQEDRRVKIDQRKALTETLGITLNALRIRAHRTRAALQRCVQQCLEQKPIR